MAFFGGLTPTEIAAVLNQPLGTVKAGIRRGMLQLRGSLEVLNPLKPHIAELEEQFDPTRSSMI